MGAYSIENDPEAVEKYRLQVEAAAANLEEQMKKTEQAIETVHEGWDDEKFRKFEENFGEDKDKIMPLKQTLDSYSTNVLIPLRDILEEYDENLPDGID